MMNGSPPVRAVLFDLDGTLLDTAPDLVAALNFVRRQEGLPEVPLEEFRQYVSQGASGLLRNGAPPGSEVQNARRRQQFLDYYEQHLMVDTKPYDGTARVLEQLDQRGIAWSVVTNKPEYLTWPIIARLGWKQRAASVVCGDTLARAKPHPAPVMLACELAGVSPQQALMVGDDPRDLEAGRAAGAVPVLAAWGYGAGEALQKGLGDALSIDSITDLLDLAALCESSGI